jgi:hypothetical protein
MLAERRRSGGLRRATVAPGEFPDGGLRSVGLQRTPEAPVGPAVTAPLPPEEDAVARRQLEGVRLSFKLPEELHRRLKLSAVRNGGTLVGTIAGWVRANTPEV